MADLNDGESTEMKGSGAKPYILKNTGGVYSCSCPAWRNQSTAIESRTCKHLRKLRGDDAERERVGAAAPPVRTPQQKEDGDASGGPPLLLAHSWDNASDLTDWWMSEKLDGVRAYWNGKELLSRLGNTYLAPDWFLEHLPQTPLDGELWIARKAFQRTVSVVRRKDKTDLWRDVRFLVFDAPSEPGDFERRMAFLAECFASRELPYARMHEHRRCAGFDDLKAELARVEAAGGEGLMLRQPGSSYEVGRSSTLLKVKTFHDAEALVISHQAGRGRHVGRLGALGVRLADGTEFSVGTGFSDRERSDPPPVGSVITFRYQELSNDGVPRFPSFVRVRQLAAAQSSLEPPSPKPASARHEPAPSAPPAGPVRRFEFSDAKASKFWEVTVDGCQVTVRFGRIGAAGQTQAKTFSDPGAAKSHADKLIGEKTAKGYVPASA